MDRGAWWATVMGSQRVGHDLVTYTLCDEFLKIYLKTKKRKTPGWRGERRG